MERASRKTKNTLEVRPISHHPDDTTVDHTVSRFLVLRFAVDLQRRLDAADVEWSALGLTSMRDLAEVKPVKVALD